MADFATRAQLKTYLGISSNSTYDALLDDMLARTTKLIQQYVGRDLLQATYTDEKHSGDGIFTELRVRHYPIISVTSVYDDPSRTFGSDSLLVANTDYVVIQANDVDNPGIIQRLASTSQNEGGWLRGIENIKVTYVGGYATIPVDLVQAQIDWASYIFRNRDARLGVSSYRIGSYSVTLKDNTLRDAAGNAIGAVLPPDDIRMILDNYREPRMESTY